MGCIGMIFKFVVYSFALICMLIGAIVVVGIAVAIIGGVASLAISVSPVIIAFLLLVAFLKAICKK